MKRILLPVLLLLCINVSTATGQIEKNTKLIGGSGFGRFDIDGGEVYVYFNANFGSFITKKFCVGGEIGSLSGFYSGNSSGYLSFAPFIRYYFNSKEKRSFFTKLSTGLGINFSSRGNGGITGMADLSIGHDWFLIPSVAFEASVFGNLVPSLELASSVGLRFGLQIYLNKNKKKEDK